MRRRCGGRWQTEMAFTQGQLITAAGLISINSAWQTYYLKTGDGYGSASLTTPWFYVRSPSGFFCRIVLYTGGWFPSCTGYLDRLSSADPDAPAGGYTTVWSAKKTAFNDSWTYDFHSQDYGGAGWYRARASSSKGAHSAAFYCGQNNCVQGNLLTYWDNPANSGNRMVGTPLTVANLNSGRAGTF